MTGRHKPRRPRWISRDPMGLAKTYAGRLTAAEVGQVMAAVQDGFRALREGVATEAQWGVVTSALNIADAIELQGVVRGARGHIQAAQQALAGILRRAMATGTWHPTALYYQELDDVRTGIDIYDYQLRQLSYGEYQRALAHAIAEVRSTGGIVINFNQAGQQAAAAGARP
jgi:hypothetical protein